MTKEYMLQGLCCPNCAAKIERALGALEGVRAASINMINTTLHIEVDDGFTDLKAAVERVVHRIESDVVVREVGEEHDHDHEHDHGHEHDHK